MNEPVPARRIREFENYGLGLFVHWGLYSQRAEGEKIMYFQKIPKNEYRRLMEIFTASRFNGRELARTAKACGMKYIVLTARHHDGFSLFDTKGLNEYDAPHAACRRDLVGEFIEGCNAEGVSPILYHTTLDWYQDSFQNDFPAYIDYLYASVELLCTQYGKIGGLWFDGNWSRPDVDWQEDRFYAMIRRHQPEAILANNSGQRERGAIGHPELDIVTFEQGHPTPLNRSGMSKYLVAEMNQTMNEYWGIADFDVGYKSSAQLIETLCSCRKVGANYLINVGPTGEGEICLMQQALLQAIGKWAAVSKAPIYRGRPTSITSDGRSFALEQDGRIYIFVYGLLRGDNNGQGEDIGNGLHRFYGFDQPVRSVAWLDNNEALKFTQEGTTLHIECTGYPYGQFLVVRVAEVILA